MEEKHLKDIALKLIDHFLQDPSAGSGDLPLFIPAFEKYAPEKVAQLKKLLPEDQRNRGELLKMVSDPNIKPEKLIEEAEKYKGYDKFFLYQGAVDKFIEAGQGENARELLKSAPDSKQRDDAIAYLEERISSKALKDDKFDDVQKALANTESGSAKIKLLVDLAVGLNRKNTKEARDEAVKLMEEARRLAPDSPENNEDIENMLKIASGYASIEPEKAFPYLMTLVDMTNDLLMAKSLLAKYNRRNVNFKQGELLYTNNFGYGISSYTKYGKELGLMATADFDRTKNLIERLGRQDVRIMLKILLAQSILRENIGVEGLNSYYYSDGN
jgi:hypothetical protein